MLETAVDDVTGEPTKRYNLKPAVHRWIVDIGGVSQTSSNTLKRDAKSLDDDDVEFKNPASKTTRQKKTTRAAAGLPVVNSDGEEVDGDVKKAGKKQLAKNARDAVTSAVTISNLKARVKTLETANSKLMAKNSEMIGERNAEKAALSALKDQLKAKPVKIDDQDLRDLITGYQSRLTGHLSEIMKELTAIKTQPLEITATTVPAVSAMPTAPVLVAPTHPTTPPSLKHVLSTLTPPRYSNLPLRSFTDERPVGHGAPYYTEAQHREFNRNSPQDNGPWGRRGERDHALGHPRWGADSLYHNQDGGRSIDEMRRWQPNVYFGGQEAISMAQSHTPQVWHEPPVQQPVPQTVTQPASAVQTTTFTIAKAPVAQAPSQAQVSKQLDNDDEMDGAPVSTSAPSLRKKKRGRGK